MVKIYNTLIKKLSLEINWTDQCSPTESEKNI